MLLVFADGEGFFYHGRPSQCGARLDHTPMQHRSHQRLRLHVLVGRVSPEATNAALQMRPTFAELTCGSRHAGYTCRVIVIAVGGGLLLLLLATICCCCCCFRCERRTKRKAVVPEANKPAVR